uniref:Uncharacterized protein n=1 Tax=Anguilla anguilla TaxID=7936 RepID=A0A0E9WQ30_ANGAN
MECFRQHTNSNHVYSEKSMLHRGWSQESDVNLKCKVCMQRLMYFSQ